MQASSIAIATNLDRPSLVGKTLVNPSTYSGVEDEAIVVGSLLVYSRWLREDRYDVRVISTWDYFQNSVDGVIVGVKGSDLLPTLRKQVDNTTEFHAPI